MAEYRVEIIKLCEKGIYLFDVMMDLGQAFGSFERAYSQEIQLI